MTRPLVGHGYSQAQFTQLGDDGVDALVCDSTNATVPGHSVSEATLHAGLRQAIDSAPGRVVVTCFGSNIARLHTLSRIARETGRYLGLLGRSLINMSSAARAAGVWETDDHLINPAHLGYLPRHEVLAVGTGSQGEPRTALRRLAEGRHPDLELEAGDRVIFSARAIPGNEDAIEGLISPRKGQGVEVMTAEGADDAHPRLRPPRPGRTALHVPMGAAAHGHPGPRRGASTWTATPPSPAPPACPGPWWAATATFT